MAKVLRNTKIFGGKRYTFWALASNKREAQSKAKQARQRGFLARVYKTTKYPGSPSSPYVVYALLKS